MKKDKFLHFRLVICTLKCVLFVLQNNKALQEACGMLEEQLTDLEKLADIHEIKNKDLEVWFHVPWHLDLNPDP